MAKGGATKKAEIADYTDYTSYMSDLVQYKRNVSNFSYRIFCRKSGFKSPTYLKWVIDGSRPISPKSVHKFVAGLSLEKDEAHYFMLMVNYKEAKDPETKQFYYKQMLSLQHRRNGTVGKDAYEYLSRWYYVAIRELVASPDFKDDPAWIRDRLIGDLSVKEIKEAMVVLARLKLIRRDAKGRWQQTSKDLHTEREVKSLAAHSYHSDMLDLARDVLAKRKAAERDYRSLVAMMDEKTYAGLKDMIYKFQRELVEYLQLQERLKNKWRADRELYALNVQLMPLTRRRKGDL